MPKWTAIFSQWGFPKSEICVCVWLNNNDDNDDDEKDDDDKDGYKSEVCVWLSDDKKISQSLQQKQHQSEQDEDDSLF